MSPKSHRTGGESSGSEASEKLFSPRPPSPGKSQTVPNEEDVVKSSLNVSFSTTEENTSQRSPTLFSDRDSEDVLNPIMSSTKRSPFRRPIKETDPQDTPVTHNVNFKRGDDRMSPGALERRLRAELNLFDSVGDSLQQITEMDRIRDIVQAQQETVSLAQVLKNRQVLHQKDIDRMSMEAREKSAQAAKEIEVARRNALDSEVNAKKTIAEVESRAANNIAKSTKVFSEQQNQATALSLDAIRESEKVRRDAFEEYKKSVDVRLSNVGGLMTAAVSAASTAAVEAALKEHREKLESLRKESLHKVSQNYTTSFTGTNSSVASSSSSNSSQSKTSTSSITKSPVSRDTSSISKSKSNKAHQTDSIPENLTGVNLSKSTNTSKQEASSIHTESDNQRPGGRSTSSRTLTPDSISRKNVRSSEEISEAFVTAQQHSGDVSENIPEEDGDRELTEALFNSGRKSRQFSLLLHYIIVHK